jgi:hypothetical protein
MIESRVSLKESLANVRRQRDFWISQLPSDLNPEELKGFRQRLTELYLRFERNVRAIYKACKYLGKDFSALLCYAKYNDYHFYLDGIARHFEDGEIQIGLAKKVASAETKQKRWIFEYQAMVATKMRVDL